MAERILLDPDGHLDMSHTVVSGNRVTGIIKTSEDVGACGAALDTVGRRRYARSRVRDRQHL